MRLAPWLDTRVTLAALDAAVALRPPAPGLIHHSDQGVQYASNAYIARLRRIRALSSMALAGNPYENAIIESFFKTVRYEELARRPYQNYADAYTSIAAYLDVYNTERLHSRLGYQPPSEFEQRYVAEQQAHPQIPCAAAPRGECTIFPACVESIYTLCPCRLPIH